MLFARSVPSKARQAYVAEAWAGIFFGLFAGLIFSGPYYLIVAKDKLHASGYMISAMVAAPFVGSWLSLLWSNIMEGRPKKPFFVASCIISRSLYILMALPLSALSYASVICTGQTIAAISSPAYAHIMKDVFPDDHRGRIMGYVRVLLALAMICSTITAGYLLKSVSYRYIFPVGGLCGVISAVIFSRIRVSGPSHEERANKGTTWQFVSSTFGILTEDRPFRWFALSVFIYGFGNLLIAPVIPIFMVEKLGINTSEASIAGWLSIITLVAWMVSYLYWGRYVDTRSPVRATVINLLLATIVPINYIVASFFPLAWLLVPQAIVVGITNAGIELSYFNSLLEFSREGKISHYQALFAWLMGVRGTIAPFIGGAMAQSFKTRNWDFRYIFLLAAMIMLTGAILQVVGIRKCRMAVRT